MTDQNTGPLVSHNWWKAVFRDIQFWVPFAVLILGLLILRWVE